MKYIFLLLIVAFLFSCNESPKNNANEVSKLAPSVDREEKEEQQIKQIFYNVPSPVEMAQIIQNAGAVYNKELLNPYSNVDNYITTEDLALNLGVYGADLSYNRIFDQMQESLNYLVAIRKISDQLKIPQDEGSFAINRFEENIENRDSLLKVISETYANADIYLKENQRESTATLIVFGGWIEALYIATNLVNQESPDIAIMQSIAEQKFSLETIIKLTNIYNDELLVIQELEPHIKDLEKAFDKIDINMSTGEVITDKSKKTTRIDGTNEINIDYTNIVEIKNIITKIRNHIIGKS